MYSEITKTKNHTVSYNSNHEYKSTNYFNTQSLEPVGDNDLNPLHFGVKEENDYAIARKNLKEKFNRRHYFKWLKVREDTLEKLRTLSRDFHKDQLNYNKAQNVCRTISVVSRYVKIVPSTIGVIATASAFLSDAARGIALSAQASNVDYYMNMFKQIMDYDSRVTEGLYQDRSLRKISYSVKTSVHDKSKSFSARSVVEVVRAVGKGSKIVKAIDMFADQMSIREDKKEINRLGHTINSNLPHPLETEIENSIDTLRSEMKEIIDAYSQQFPYDIKDIMILIVCITIFLVFFKEISMLVLSICSIIFKLVMFLSLAVVILLLFAMVICFVVCLINR